MMSPDAFNSIASTIRGLADQEPNPNPNPNPNPTPNPAVKKKRNLPGTPGKSIYNRYILLILCVKINMRR